MRGISGLNWNKTRVASSFAGAIVIALAVYGVIGGVSADPAPPPATSTDIAIDPGTAKIPIGPRRGQQAPPIEVETYTGDGLFRLSDHLGHPVVINFWFPSCSGCRIEKPFIKAAHESFKDRGVVFLGVQSTIIDTAEDGLRFLEENGLNYPNIADTWAIPLRYEVAGYPQTIFLNPDHPIRARSFTISSQEAIDRIIDGLLSGGE